MVTRAVNDAGNFTIGPTDISIGEFGGAEADAREIGLTQGGLTFNKTSDFVIFDDADQFKGPVGAYPLTEAMEITFTMTENTLENMLLAWDLSLDRLTEADNEVTFGGDRGVNYRTLYAEGPAPGGGTAKWEIWKTIVTDTAEIGYTKDEKTLMEVTLTAILDLTKTEGQQFGRRVDVYGDDTPPTVSSISPTDTDSSVATDTTVEWTFSENIQQRDITLGNFNVTDDTGAEVAGELSYDDATFTVTFTPDAALSATTTYLTFASGEIKDMDGNEMGDNYRTTFTTA